jgi:hypothetical protein
MAYFCRETGVRIVAPGVCLKVDPKNGVQEYDATADSAAAEAAAKAALAAAKTTESEQVPSGDALADARKAAAEVLTAPSKTDHDNKKPRGQ